MAVLTVKDKMEFSDRLPWMMVLFGGLLGLLLLRLGYLQVWEGRKFRQLAAQNSLRVVRSHAPRGIIADRHGKILARNHPTYTVSVVPAELQSEVDTIGALCGMLGLPEDEVRAKVHAARSRKYELLTVKAYVPKTLVARLEEHAPELPGVVIQAEPQRFYREGALASSVIGFVSEVSEEQVLLKPERYVWGDAVGQIGVERSRDEALRGTSGVTKILVNAQGHELQVVSTRPPQIGRDCQLTIDADLQRTAEDGLRRGSRRGAAVAMDPRTGELLVLATWPPIPLDQFNDGLTPEEWRGIASNPDRPLVNRAVTGLYAPGSLLKPFVALWALREGKIPPRAAVECRGRFWYGEWDYECWQHEGHGSVALSRAIAESCDVYFYQLALKAGPSGLAAACREFGLGSRTGVDLPGEEGGLVPTPEWKRRRLEEGWFVGNTIQMGIGQGYLTATPIQLATAYAAIANQGVAFRPRVVSQLGADRPPPVEAFRVSASPAQWAAVREAMREAVASGAGTARTVRVEGLDVCAKTATIQHGGPERETHAALACFAPRERPEIVVVVLLEEAGKGGGAAGPVAREILSRWHAKARRPSPSGR